MLKALSVRNFRNLLTAKIKFSPGIIIIIGDNGQGKTNLLESIYFLSYGKPFRGLKAQAINWHKNEATIAGETEKDRIEIIIHRDQENKTFINGKQKKAISILGRFVSIVFRPEEIEIINGPPPLRRTWLDKLIATINKNYLYNLVNYQRTLQNKNKLLKLSSPDPAQLVVWNRGLAKYGSRIWQEREAVTAVINQNLRRESQKLVGKKVFLDYKNPLSGKDGQLAESLYLNKLASQENLERRLQATIFGPHRDDFKIIIEEKMGKNILQKELASFGSRAEQRQAVLLLKMNEAKIFADFFGEAPVILLDDAASELDERNRQLLFSHLYARQIFITSTSLEALPEAVKSKAQILKVENGRFTSN